MRMCRPPNANELARFFAHVRLEEIPVAGLPAVPSIETHVYASPGFGPFRGFERLRHTMMATWQ